jgi:hypothetical protein
MPFSTDASGCTLLPLAQARQLLASGVMILFSALFSLSSPMAMQRLQARTERPAHSPGSAAVSQPDTQPSPERRAAGGATGHGAPPQAGVAGGSRVRVHTVTAMPLTGIAVSAAQSRRPAGDNTATETCHAHGDVAMCCVMICGQAGAGAQLCPSQDGISWLPMGMIVPLRPIMPQRRMAC